MSLRGPRKCARCGTPIRQARGRGRVRRYCSGACRQSVWDRERRAATRPPEPVDPLLSSASDEWYTPPDVFERLSAKWGPFDLDAAADPRSPLWDLVPNHWTVEDDGLAQPWRGRVWLNSPYGDALPMWLGRAAEQVACGNAELVCCLVPARTDTRWWWAALDAGAEVEFIRGRIKFVLPDGSIRNGATFPSAVVVFRQGRTGLDPDVNGIPSTGGGR